MQAHNTELTITDDAGQVLYKGTGTVTFHEPPKEKPVRKIAIIGNATAAVLAAALDAVGEEVEIVNGHARAAARAKLKEDLGPDPCERPGPYGGGKRKAQWKSEVNYNGKRGR